MTPSVASVFFLTGVLALFAVPSTAAPATYDQRQDGKYNVHANLENFLIIVATGGHHNLLNDLVVQAVDLQDLTSRAKGESKASAVPLAGEETAQEHRPNQKPSATVVYETEDVKIGKEPYRVEIVHIEKDRSSEEVPRAKALAEEAEPAAEDKPEEEEPVAEPADPKAELLAAVPNPVQRDEEPKHARSLWKDVTRKLAEVIEKEKDFLERRKKPEDVDKELRDEVPKNGKPGAALKKQLSKKEQESVYLTLREKNDVSLIEQKPEELKLLGGGIENCGPGRYRDGSGICQIDLSFNVD